MKEYNRDLIIVALVSIVCIVILTLVFVYVWEQVIGGLEAFKEIK